MTQWCTICNAAPSDGILTIESPFDEGHTMTIEACQDCVNKLPWEGGIVKKENDHV